MGDFGLTVSSVKQRSSSSRNGLTLPFWIKRCAPFAGVQSRFLFIATCLFIFLFFPRLVGSTTVPVDIMVFSPSICAGCQQLREQYFPLLLQTHDSIQVTYYDLDYEENREYLQELCAGIGSSNTLSLDAVVPVVIVDQYLLIGEDEIRAELEGVLQEMALVEDEASPFSTRDSISQSPADGLIHLAYFYQPGCKACSRVKDDLMQLEAHYRQLRVDYLSLSREENRFLQEEVARSYGVPIAERLLFPAIFIGDDYFLEDIDMDDVELVVQDHRGEGARSKWILSDETERELEREQMAARYAEVLRIPAVAIAGLIDGINPCAFSIVIFLITYLSYLRREKREILLVGVLFVVAVFASYLLIGFGLLEILRTVGFFASVRRVIFLAGVAFTGVLGILSLVDFFRLRNSRPEGMLLKIPSRFRKFVNTFAGRRMRTRRFLIPVSLGIGFLASSVEFVCTGQVYLPMLVFLSGVRTTRMAALVPLFIYNICFILPLVGVFVAVYLGVSSKLVARTLSENFALSKLLTAALFFGLAILLFILM